MSVISPQLNYINIYDSFSIIVIIDIIIYHYLLLSSSLCGKFCLFITFLLLLLLLLLPRAVEVLMNVKFHPTGCPRLLPACLPACITVFQGEYNRQFIPPSRCILTHIHHHTLEDSYIYLSP